MYKEGKGVKQDNFKALKISIFGLGNMRVYTIWFAGSTLFF
jgi:hypothetical protein